MTLHYFYSDPGWLFVVSDRLTSRGETPFDPKANKNVIHLSVDGFSLISYAGLATTEAWQTDEWIARRLAFGRKLPTEPPSRGPGLAPSIRFGHDVQRLCTEEVPLRLAEELNFHGIRPEVSIAGLAMWDAGHGPVRRHWCLRARRQGNWQVSRCRLDYHATFFCPHGDWREEEVEQTLSALEPNGTVPLEVDEILSVLVSGVRRSAASRPNAIGNDCMTVQPLSAGKRVTVRFFPGATEPPDWQAEPDLPRYSPWVVGPSLICPPHRVDGSWNLEVTDEYAHIGGTFVPASEDAFQVIFESPPRTDGSAGFRSVQDEDD